MCVASRCGCWVWSLGGALDDVIGGQCMFMLSNLTPLPCFHIFFRYITINHNPYIAFIIVFKTNLGCYDN